MNEFKLELLTGKKGLIREEITLEEIYRPGLELTGFYDFIPSDRIHVFGK